jgi:hypothetical protein
MVRIACSIENSVETLGIKHVIVTIYKSTFSIRRNSDPSVDPAGRPSRNPRMNGSIPFTDFLISLGLDG